MKWFPFQCFMLHVEYSIDFPEEHLKSLLKLLSMFKIRIIYDETINNKYVPEAVVIMCINCGKSVGCSLYNKKIENFITHFVTNIVFHNIGLFWIIQSNKNLSFGFQKTFPSWILNGPLYKATICSLLHGSVFEDYFTTSIREKYNLM